MLLTAFKCTCMFRQSYRILRGTSASIGCCSSRTEDKDTHHTPPHLQRLHITHNGCAYLCVLSVSRSVVSLCVFVTAPLVPFAFRRRVAGLGWSCFSRIRSQQQITAISPHTITAARNVTAVSNTTAVLSIQTTYCSLGRNYE